MKVSSFMGQLLGRLGENGVGFEKAVLGRWAGHRWA